MKWAASTVENLLLLVHGFIKLSIHALLDLREIETVARAWQVPHHDIVSLRVQGLLMSRCRHLLLVKELLVLLILHLLYHLSGLYSLNELVVRRVLHRLLTRRIKANLVLRRNG